MIKLSKADISLLMEAIELMIINLKSAGTLWRWSDGEGLIKFTSPDSSMSRKMLLKIMFTRWPALKPNLILTKKHFWGMMVSTEYLEVKGLSTVSIWINQ